MVYFILMLITFLTTHEIIIKNQDRREKLGTETEDYSVESYKKHGAIKDEEKVYDELK